MFEPRAFRQALRRGFLALSVVAMTVLLSACSEVGRSGSFGFWDVIWSMIAFFFLFMFIWIFVGVFADIFRRTDLSGGWKAVWILVIVILPFLGCLIYMITRPKLTAQDVQMAAQAEAAQKAVAGVSTADELAKLQQLRDSGAISAAEFDTLKGKLLA